MVGKDPTSTDPAHGRILRPVPVTPSGQTERPEGLAFDVEKGTDLPGVPVGEQTPKNPGAAHAQETGGGVGLAVPGHPESKAEERPDEEKGGES